MNVVEATGLGKRYGGTWALHECTLAIPAGRVAALVGPNGAGKSTLLNLAVGLTAVRAITQQPVGSVELRSYVYMPGSYLLPHSDCQKQLGRLVAFAYYFIHGVVG